MGRKRKCCNYSRRHKIRIIVEQTNTDLCNLNQEVGNSLRDNDRLSSSVDISINQDYSPDSNVEINYETSSEAGPSHYNSDYELSDCSLQLTNSDTDNGISNDDGPSNRPTFNSALADWALQHNIKHNALSSLLKLLKPHVTVDIPQDARSLLKTPRAVDIKSIGGGEYWHNGLANVLKLIYCNRPQSDEPIKLIINIDGLPLAKSSNACFWPILASEYKTKNVYIVGCFYGNEKPTDSNEFMEFFINELNDLMSNGFVPDDDVNKGNIEVSLHALVCDAPAKGFLMKVKGHTGYSSCTKCSIVGEYVNNRVCFPNTTEHCQPLERTNESVRAMTDEEFHTGISILSVIPNFGLVSQIPLDYMHLVCLGIMKKLINLWLSGPLNVRLSGREVEEISSKLISLRMSVPNEFQRKPRELKYQKQWKATEFRQFLLYTGPLILKRYLKKYVFENFLALHVAITILTKSEFVCNPKFLSYAEDLLKYFVRTFELIYGKHHVSHNVHGLLHLAKDCEKFGCLDEFSAFKFESYLSNVKKKLRKSDRPLQQLAKRYIEEEINLQLTSESAGKRPSVDLKGRQETGLLCENISIDSVNHYSILVYENIYINCKDGKNDIFMFHDGSVSSVKNIVQLKDKEDFHLVCYDYQIVGSLYTLNQFDSKFIQIQIVQENFQNVKCHKLCEIKCKLWRMPYEDAYVVIPLHQLN